jgi:hypothetical protein
MRMCSELSSGVEHPLLFLGRVIVESDDVLKMVCVARVMAKSTALNARIESMKAANQRRLSDGYSLAYDEAAFTKVEEEMANLVRYEIGL